MCNYRAMNQCTQDHLPLNECSFPCVQQHHTFLCLSQVKPRTPTWMIVGTSRVQYTRLDLDLQTVVGELGRTYNSRRFKLYIIRLWSIQQFALVVKQASCKLNNYKRPNRPPTFTSDSWLGTTRFPPKDGTCCKPTKVGAATNPCGS